MALKYDIQWHLNIVMDKYFLFGSEFMFSVSAGRNVKIYDLCGFDSNIKWDLILVTVQSHEGCG